MMLGELRDRNKQPKVFKYSDGHRKGTERMGKALLDEFKTKYPEETEQAKFLERALDFYQDYFIALGAGELNKAQNVEKRWGHKMVY